MKVGILTFFRPINYGAYLQAYALSHRLNQENDIDAEIIDFHMPEEDEFYQNAIKLRKNIFKSLFNRKRFKTFRNQLAFQTMSDEKCCSDSIDAFISFVDNKYDIIIAGSDEIWKVDGYRGFPTAYFLPGDLHCKKVSYAASGRTSFNSLSERDQNLLKKFLNDFTYIGVRDNVTELEVENIINCKEKVHFNFDPTFVYDFHPNIDNGKKLLNKHFGISDDKKIIAVMYNEGLREKPNICRQLKKTYGEEFNFISLYDWNAYFKGYPELTPFEWIDVIAAVDGVISMYFHGICFSMITGTPFLAIEKRDKNNKKSKLYDMLERINLLDYFILGTNNVIQGDKMTSLIKSVRLGEKWDFNFVIDQARAEFDQFIKELRKID